MEQSGDPTPLAHNICLGNVLRLPGKKLLVRLFKTVHVMFLIINLTVVANSTQKRIHC